MKLLLLAAFVIGATPLAHAGFWVSCDAGETYEEYSLSELYSIGSPCAQMSVGPGYPVDHREAVSGTPSNGSAEEVTYGEPVNHHEAISSPPSS